MYHQKLIQRRTIRFRGLDPCWAQFTNSHRNDTAQARCCCRLSNNNFRRTYMKSAVCWNPDHGDNSNHSAKTRNTNFVLFDSLSKTFKAVQADSSSDSTKKDDDNQQRSKGLAWYTCGPTVYDSTHLGHARTYVCLDLIHRWMLHGHSTFGGNASRPIFIMNITDIDDKIIERAKERNVHPSELAIKYEREFLEDLDHLNVMRPTMMLRVSEHVDDHIIPYIERLIHNEMAYILPDEMNDSDSNIHDQSKEGSVYFDVTAFERASGRINRYGKLAPSQAASNDSIFYESNVAMQEDSKALERKKRKRDPRDFVLWKQHKPTTDGNLWWDSPWGKGRPGWHIECSAMIQAAISHLEPMGYQMTVHAGGVDLKFPHHTNEIAQAEAYLNIPNDKRTCWIPHWVHTGHLYIEGLKMSKSLKNFITVRELLSGDHKSDSDVDDAEMSNASMVLTSPADDFRLWCLGMSGSYRGNATFSKSRLAEARRLRETKILRFLIEGQKWVDKTARRGNGEEQDSHMECQTFDWTTDDFEFWLRLQSELENATTALNGNVGNLVDSSRSGYDMNGGACLKAIIEICNIGQTYISNSSPSRHPSQPLEILLEELRSLLQVLGFTEKTFLAGKTKANLSDVDTALAGEGTALIDEFIKFRTIVREIALNALKENKDADTAKQLLALCDKLRDEALPNLGVEVSDTQPSEDVHQGANWRFCSRSSKKPSAKGAEGAPEQVSLNGGNVPSQPLNDVALEDFFKSGIYEGKFCTFDKDHLPLTHIDGSDVSKSTRKKLLKKLRKQEKRLQEKEPAMSNGMQ